MQDCTSCKLNAAACIENRLNLSQLEKFTQLDETGANPLNDNATSVGAPLNPKPYASLWFLIRGHTLSTVKLGTFIMKKKIILSDFDGTITTTNVLDSLYEKFGGPGFAHHMERWRRGEISTMEEVELIFSTMKATRQEMEAFLSTVELDPGFKPLLRHCRKQDIPFAVVSDGLRWYIDYILDFHEVEVPDVFAGDISFSSDGYRFSFPWYDSAFPLRSTAKPLIVKDYQGRNYSVTFIGDGLTDVEAAEVADVVYAKDVLLYEAGERGIEARKFENMGDISRDL